MDESPEAFAGLVKEWYDGDYYAAAESYYANVGDVVAKTDADIIGHFDLITKFNEGGCLFDESHPRYRRAWKQAADKLLSCGRPFEINTGAMSRGYRTEPYPAKDIRDYIRARGGKLILSSDSHRKDTIAYRFQDYLDET